MPVPDQPSDPGVQGLAALDEILQVMYWLRGERLAACGLVQPAEGQAPGGTPRYALTAAGVHEGARRFADEFADLTRPGHYECADPDCECQRTGNPADCGHRHA